MSLREAFHFSGIPPQEEQELCEATGLVITFTTIPTTSTLKPGKEYIGGVGATSISRAFYHAARERLGPENVAVINSGNIMRQLANETVGMELSEEEFKSWRTGLGEDSNAEFDRHVDTEVAHRAQEAIKNGAKLVIVESKLYGLLQAKSAQFANGERYISENPPNIFIGIETTHPKATRRMLERQQKNDRLNCPDTFRELYLLAKKVEAERHQRWEADKRIFEATWGQDFAESYTAAELLSYVHGVINNTRDRSPEEMLQLAHYVLDYFSDLVPCVFEN